MGKSNTTNELSSVSEITNEGSHFRHDLHRFRFYAQKDNDTILFPNAFGFAEWHPLLPRFLFIDESLGCAIHLFRSCCVRRPDKERFL